MRLHAARVLETGEAMLLRLIPGAAPDGRRGDARRRGRRPQPVPERRVAGDLPRAAAGGAARSSIVGETPIARALAEIARAAGYDVVRGTARSARRPTPRWSSPPTATRRGGARWRARWRPASATSASSRAPGAAARCCSRSTSPDALNARGPHARGARHRRAHAGRGRDLDPRRDHRRAHRARAGAADRAGHASSGPRPPSTRSAGWRSSRSTRRVHLDVGGERVYFCCEGCRVHLRGPARAAVTAPAAACGAVR